MDGFLGFLNALSTPGGRMMTTVALLLLGLISDANGVRLGHDVAIAALVALIPQVADASSGRDPGR